VELFRAESWALGRQAGSDDLFEGAQPLDGLRQLVRPAPHVTLVLVAHSFLQRRGHLSPGARRRATAAASEDRVWADAHSLARRLRLPGALEMLRRSLQQPDPWSPARRLGELARVVALSPPSARPTVARKLLPRRARPVLVSLSGPDGSGKSTQAALLRETLGALGVTTGGAWVPTTHRPPLPAAVRRFADRWRRPSPAPVPKGEPVPDRPLTVPAHVRLAEHVWITTAAVSNAAKLWRSVLRSPGPRVLVLDRFSLDADVKLTYWYALRRGADIRFERRLFRAIAPTADVAVLLTVRPETNYERRADEGSLDAFRDYQRIYAEAAGDLHAVLVDAERPASDVARDVAEIVWRRLP
jgi:thymidylate kinase